MKCVQAKKNFYRPNMMKMCPVSNTLSFIQNSVNLFFMRKNTSDPKKNGSSWVLWWEFHIFYQRMVPKWFIYLLIYVPCDMRVNELFFSQFIFQMYLRFDISIKWHYFDLSSCNVIFLGDESWKVLCKMFFLAFEYIYRI